VRRRVARGFDGMGGWWCGCLVRKLVCIYLSFVLRFWVLAWILELEAEAGCGRDAETNSSRH
jgi:hypothetical protein